MSLGRSPRATMSSSVRVSIPSSSLATAVIDAPTVPSTCVAPRYAGDSTTAISPSSITARAIRSSACWAPFVISTSSTVTPKRPATNSRRSCRPSVGPYCTARVSSVVASAERIRSTGSASAAGRPPASDNMSGRSVRCNSSRMRDEPLLRARCERRSFIAAVDRAGRVGGSAESSWDCHYQDARVAGVLQLAGACWPRVVQ